MSINSAISNALSGLNASARNAAVVSNNISNAYTEGFGRREIELAANGRATGGGVRVLGVTRYMNQVILGDRRDSDATLARAEAQSAFLQTVQNALGAPGEPGSLTELVAELESALISAADQPESVNRLQQTVDRMNQLTDRLRQTSQVVQRERSSAEAAIAQAVTDLNADLARIEQLNIDIRKATLLGDTGTNLFDERQRLIDRVAELVPVREIDRGNNVVALLTDNGLLLDGPAPTIGFDEANVITPYLSYPANLSGLTVNDIAIDVTRDRHLLSGGRLDGLFAVRDALGPEVQNRLDGFARDLIERFQDPAADPTLAAGDAGLFTDSGAAFDAVNLLGLSSRIGVNANVDPLQGGEVWRLRDGLNAATQGNTGDARGLQRLSTALGSLVVPVSGGFGAGAQTATSLAGEVITSVGGVLDLAQSDATYARARSEALDVRLKEDGVDTDAELQKLLLLEQAYAANARVIQTAQTMLDRLLEI